MTEFRKRFLQGGQLGQFFHFGPYAALGRGEQALWRERLDQRDYARKARAWLPASLDMKDWVQQAVDLGADYAVLTTRHHDAYCLWNTQEHDYNSMACFGRDLVAEYVEACREAGLRVGLYYSLADWTSPAYFRGPEHDPEAFSEFRNGIFRQVEELLTGYGQIDILWFDACTPHDSPVWQSERLIRMIRGLQPGILVNSRLGVDVTKGPEHMDGGIGPGDSDRYGDFSIGEGRVLHHLKRPWETCATSTRARWGYAKGEAWKSAEEIGEQALQVLSTGGNYMLNVGPDGTGRIPGEYRKLVAELGPWLKTLRPHLQDAKPFAGLTFVTRGWLYQRTTELIAVLRLWDGEGDIEIHDLDQVPVAAELVGDSCSLEIEEISGGFQISGLPTYKPEFLFPILKLSFPVEPQPSSIMAKRNWGTDPERWFPFGDWAETAHR